MLHLFAVFILCCTAFRQIGASPLLEEGLQPGSLQRRTEPYFPDQPESCQICAKDYGSIRSCAEAAPVLKNFTMVMFNPGAFVDVVQCACADTFKAVFPQCVDCFIRTGQEEVIMDHDLPAVVEGVRQACAVASTIFGNVTNSNNAPEPSPTPSSTDPTTTIHRTLLFSGLSVVGTMIASNL